MLTHIVTTINWVDVVLVALLVRVIFIGVKNGFIAECCKFFGVILALYLSLHLYRDWAGFLVKSLKGPEAVWEFLSFVLLAAAGYGIMGAVRWGLSFLFKAEAQHEGFNKYAAGILAIGRGFLTASLMIVALLLTQQPWLCRQAFGSVTYQMVGKTAVHTYDFIFHKLVDKIVGGQTYNAVVQQVVHYGINSRVDHRSGH